MLRLRRRNRVWGLVAMTGVFVVLVSATAYLLLGSKLAVPMESSEQVVSEVQEPLTLDLVDSRIMVTGDVFWSRKINDAAMASTLKYKFPFARLHEFNRDDYDAWVVNMECPLSNGVQPTSAEEEVALSFDCDPNYLPEAAKWFTAMTLANNHTDNRGATGFAETQENLEKNGIQYFGNYDPEDLDNDCDVLSMPARATMSDGSVKDVELPMAWCGYHGVFQIPSQTAVNVIKQYASVMPVIALPHSGAEYKATPDQIKTTLYRSMIDAGADVVLGDHPHWVQTSESYKGHLIVYSMGNFMFDQQRNNEVTRAAAVVINASVSQQDNPDLERWVELASECKSYHDSCLATARNEGLQKLSVHMKFSIVVAEDTGLQTHPASSAVTSAVSQRLMWSKTIQGLSGMYSGEL